VRNIKRRKEDLKLWFGLSSREEMAEKDRRGKPFKGKVCSIDKNEKSYFVFQAKREIRNPIFLWQ
jgi:hypothetical protein